MKKITSTISFILMLIIASTSFSQTTATNFTADDCHAVNHDLFTELNSGKVIVIAWVMPCAGCISGALAGYTAAESYATSNPGQVLFYLVDDYGNTSCSSLGAWGDNNGMTNAVPFSNAVIDMANYGTAGMPKVVVLGGTSHTVFYNENNSNIDQTNITTAINNALATSSLSEVNKPNDELVVYPNPSNQLVSLDVVSLGFDKSKEITISLKDVLGNDVIVIFKGKVALNQETIQFNTAELSNGNYFIYCSEGSKMTKVVVAH